MTAPSQSLNAQAAAAVRRAIAAVLPDLADADPLIRPSDHADMQCNAALALAKRAGRRPAELAGELREQLLAAPGPIASAEVSGPGFLNLVFGDAAIWAQAAVRLADDRLGVGRSLEGRRTVLDYSAPNIAKEMHVGHLRTTIIGDAIARVLGHLGVDVVRQNHLGDWGTQFGMLIQYLDEHPEAQWHRGELDAGDSAVSALDRLYRAARQAFDADEAFADRARARVVALQAGDPATIEAWRAIVAESEATFFEIYRRLGVLLTADDSVGESFYNDMLGEVAAELENLGVAVESQGALCVFVEGIVGPDDQPIPLMVRKSDGGYGYDTTDLATIRYRIRELKADQILYVVDARQALHFKLIFAAARAAGWLSEATDVEHVAFGTVMGPDGKPFKTRAGGTPKLGDLLDDAVAQARKVVAEKNAERNTDMPAADLDLIAESVGIGAVKYADLSTSRLKDYSFDVERMVALTGNTGAYLQYAHARICSILRRAERLPEAPATVTTGAALAPAERALVLTLDSFGDTLADVAATLEPHKLCGYLFSVARAFTDFYENCPVLAAPDAATRENRLALCSLTARTLSQGLGLLGIAAPERL